MPIVSVIMAVHNEPEHILDAAVDSILTQTLSDLEYIICDDGSDEKTYAVVDKWRRTDDRITVLRNKKSMGAGFARNMALARATSDYVAIMDADDISAPNRLEREYEFLSQTPEYAFVGTRSGIFSNQPNDGKSCYWYVERPAAKDFLMTLPFAHPSIMFKRSAICQVGGYRTTRRVMRSEDYDLLMRLYEIGAIGVNLADTLYYLRNDEQTLRKRKYRYRFCECIVKMEGFSKLGLMPRGIAFALKPLVVGLIPNPLLNNLKQNYYKKH